jgi:hypothetical protein
MPVLIRNFLLFCLLAAGPFSTARAENLQLHEQEIKAALLYNFLKYTDWPPSAVSSSSITLCVFGSDPFQGYLQPMAGRSVNQRSIAIRQVSDAASAGGCNLLFVNADEQDAWPALHEALKGKSALTVSDFDTFVARGGMIQFGHRDNHISATLNMDAINAAGLHVEDRLLRLVTVLHPATQGGQP